MLHGHFSLPSKAWCGSSSFNIYPRASLVWPKRHLVKTTWSYLDLKLVQIYLSYTRICFIQLISVTFIPFHLPHAINVRVYHMFDITEKTLTLKYSGWEPLFIDSDLLLCKLEYLSLWSLTREITERILFSKGQGEVMLKGFEIKSHTGLERQGE